MNETIPKTEIELEKWMKDNCYNFNNYSINGNAIWEGYGIDKIGGIFYWYYTERGEKRTLEIFKTESELIEYAYNQVKSDKWTKTHCVGFVFDKNESESLAKILKEMNIEYFQDLIPYHGPNKPAFRTFVLGCDYKKIEYLKDRYFNET
jgi:hypothetical protein